MTVRPKFGAQERRWVMQLLARLTPDQRRRYEAACKTAEHHHRSGKLYDRAKAEIAERILYEDARAQGGQALPARDPLSERLPNV